MWSAYWHGLWKISLREVLKADCKCWHLEQRVKVIDGIEATEPSCKAHASTPSQHGKRIHEGCIAYKVEYRVDPFAFRDSP